jgi:DMSO/TMAO reductase YedYZ molybdopterin-dependent catalytic subunit
MNETSGLFTGDERKRKQEEMRRAGRLPPGQSLTLKWPVLHYGNVPRFDPQTWRLRCWGRIQSPLELMWAEFSALPQYEHISDFHCVTRWSRFDNRWSGIAMQTILGRVQPQPDASHVLVHAPEGFTANVPLADLQREGVLIATQHDGQPLTPEHGAPARLIVPHLYAWKAVKWINGLEFLSHDEAGFWEKNGYHMYGDPYREQRLDTD